MRPVCDGCKKSGKYSGDVGRIKLGIHLKLHCYDCRSDLICKKHVDGKTIEQISDDTLLSPSTVHKLLKRRHFSRPLPEGRYPIFHGGVQITL